jgi:hypothetical protein
MWNTVLKETRSLRHTWWCCDIAASNIVFTLFMVSRIAQLIYGQGCGLGKQDIRVRFTAEARDSFYLLHSIHTASGSIQVTGGSFSGGKTAGSRS